VAAAWARARLSPGNLVLEGVLDVATDLTWYELDILTPVGVNGLRAMPGWGIRTWGVRTLSSDPDLARIATVRQQFIDNREAVLERNRKAAEIFLRPRKT
jgi:hypothetical protein